MVNFIYITIQTDDIYEHSRLYGHAAVDVAATFLN